MEAPIQSVLSLRSYGAEFHPHTHDYVQIVLPIVGTMDIDIESRGQTLDSRMGAVIPPTSRHGQLANRTNTFLVVDCPASIGNELAERFDGNPFFRISPALRRLIEYIELSSRHSAWLRANADLCLPLLLDAINDGAARPSRLDALRRQMEISIDRRWKVDDMARVAGVSKSRLHILFRDAFGQSPNRYLAALRLSHAMRLLSSTSVPVCEVAQDSGFSDQSALTRAMRHGLGVTPGRYRRNLQ